MLLENIDNQARVFSSSGHREIPVMPGVWRGERGPARQSSGACEPPPRAFSKCLCLVPWPPPHFPTAPSVARRPASSLCALLDAQFSRKPRGSHPLSLPRTLPSPLTPVSRPFRRLGRRLLCPRLQAGLALSGTFVRGQSGSVLTARSPQHRGQTPWGTPGLHSPVPARLLDSISHHFSELHSKSRPCEKFLTS